MKKIVLSLAVLASLSGVALAKSDIDPRDRQPLFQTNAAQTEIAPLLVNSEPVSNGGLSAFERTQRQAEINENSGN